MKFLNSEGVEKLCEKIGSLLAGKLNTLQGTENTGKVQIVNNDGMVQPGNLSGNFPEDLVADSNTSDPISVRGLSQSIKDCDEKINETDEQLKAQELDIATEQRKIGNLESLETQTKTDIVSAINEVNTTVDNKSKEINTKIGDLSELKTTAKTDVVSAVNENIEIVNNAIETVGMLDSRIKENSDNIDELETDIETVTHEVDNLKIGSDEIHDQISANEEAIQSNNQTITNVNNSKAGILIDEEVGNPLTGIVMDETIQNPVLSLKELGETAQAKYPGNNLIDINEKILVNGTAYYGSEVNIPSGTKLYVRRSKGVSLAIQGLDSEGTIVTVVTNSYVMENKIVITTNTDLTALFIAESSRDSFVYREGRLMVSKTDFTEIEDYVGGEPSPNVKYPQAAVPLLGYDTIQETANGYAYSRSAEFDPEDPLQYYAVKIESNDGNVEWIGTKNKIPVLYSGDVIDFISGVVQRKNKRVDYSAGTKEWASDEEGSVYIQLEDLSEAITSGTIYSNVASSEDIHINNGKLYINTANSLDTWNSIADEMDIYFIFPLIEDLNESAEIVGELPTDHSLPKLSGTGILNFKYVADLKTFIVKTIQNILN